MVMDFFKGCTNYVCCQGEVGVGVPGPRGERGDSGLRVRHRLHQCVGEDVIWCETNTGVAFSLCHVSGRGGPRRLGWRERVNGEYQTLSFLIKHHGFFRNDQEAVFMQAQGQKPCINPYCYELFFTKTQRIRL